MEENNIDYEKILADEGMPAELPNTQKEIAKHLPKGTIIVEFQEEFEKIRAMQNLSDEGVRRENENEDITNGEMLPCLKLKRDLEERGLKKH